MTESANSENQPSWQPLDALQRRVLGVLVEKAKTTPEGYPMSVNAIKTACNQKSNRFPQMDLDADDVAATLDELRDMGVVAEIQGDGRTSRYRHKAYEWLGVDKTELAVMTELLLRGEQTVGELRARAARMEPIENLAELKPVLDRLIQCSLVVSLTPEGRGQIVTHGLYPDHEKPDAAAVARLGGGTAGPERTNPSTSAADLRAGFEELKSVVADLSRRVHELENRAGRSPVPDSP
jgi:uncharacterized protein YceH (UPF0502 family)